MDFAGPNEVKEYAVFMGVHLCSSASCYRLVRKISASIQQKLRLNADRATAKWPAATYKVRNLCFAAMLKKDYLHSKYSTEQRTRVRALIKKYIARKFEIFTVLFYHCSAVQAGSAESSRFRYTVHSQQHILTQL
jgi:hypothetical protein